MSYSTSSTNDVSLIHIFSKSGYSFLNCSIVLTENFLLSPFNFLILLLNILLDTGLNKKNILPSTDEQSYVINELLKELVKLFLIAH